MASFDTDELKAALSCGICQDFLHVLSEPKTSPCLNTYCMICLQNLIQKNKLQEGSSSCPECRYVPQDELGEFKVSPTISFPECDVCHQCYPTDHPGHACEDIKKVANQQKKSIGGVITQGKDLRDKHEKAIQDTEAYKAKLEKHAKDTTDKIYNEMNTMIQAVHNKYEEYKEQVLKEKESQIKQVTAHLEHLELQKSIVQSQVNRYRTIAEHGHPVEIANLGKEIDEKLQEWSEKPDIALKLKPSGMED